MTNNCASQVPTNLETPQNNCIIYISTPLFLNPHNPGDFTIPQKQDNQLESLPIIMMKNFKTCTLCTTQTTICQYPTTRLHTRLERYQNISNQKFNF